MSISPYKLRYPELEQRYELHETLGSGGFAKVKAAVHKLTGEKVAVKIMNKESLGVDLPRVYREIKCLKNLHHQHICQLFEVIETRHMIYMVLEFCPGGELFDYIVAKERLREREARSFFRQILSALKYVHEAGYIHRDLKPENLLLDGDSNIKLIDFGLVAEPNEPQELLATCCGSPAYAAPELIRGGPYIGTRADVWSLGVLLYALLNGFLPFDDDHTPSLYRLIQRGEYEIPEWLSLESIAIISQLLQTDPERRVTVDKLLCNKWVMTGFHQDVDWISKIDMNELDSECVAELAHYNGINEEAMEEELQMWKYDENTATYFLLMQQKLRGKQPEITVPPKQIPLVPPSPSTGVGVSPLVRITASVESFGREAEEEGARKEEEEEETYLTPEEDLIKQDAKAAVLNETPSPPICETPEPYPGKRRISLGQPIHPPTGEIQSMQKHLEKFLPRDVSVYDSNEHLSPPPQEPPGEIFRRGLFSLPPNHKLSVNVDPELPRLPMTHSPSTDFKQMYGVKKDAVKKTCSYDAQLNKLIHQRNIPVPSTPQPARKSRFGSIPGNLLRKAKRVFTPRSARQNSENPIEPRRIKGVYDVTSTSMKAPEQVIAEIERVLTEIGIIYRKKGYVLRCKLAPMTTNLADRKRKNIEFDLEVCFIPTLDMIGIRRKRIKGDTWEFKNICGQIFRATHI